MLTAEHQLTTTYAYDGPKGNLTRVTDSGRGATPREEEAADFIDGRYPETLTNAADHGEERTYDARFGLAKTLTDANDRTTTLAYDAFGRETRRTTPGRRDDRHILRVLRRFRGGLLGDGGNRDGGVGDAGDADQEDVDHRPDDMAVPRQARSYDPDRGRVVRRRDARPPGHALRRAGPGRARDPAPLLGRDGAPPRVRLRRAGPGDKRDAPRRRGHDDDVCRQPPEQQSNQGDRDGDGDQARVRRRRDAGDGQPVQRDGGVGEPDRGGGRNLVHRQGDRVDRVQRGGPSRRPTRRTATSRRSPTTRRGSARASTIRTSARSNSDTRSSGRFVRGRTARGRRPGRTTTWAGRRVGWTRTGLPSGATIRPARSARWSNAATRKPPTPRRAPA